MMLNRPETHNSSSTSAPDSAAIYRAKPLPEPPNKSVGNEPVDIDLRDFPPVPQSSPSRAQSVAGILDLLTQTSCQPISSLSSSDGHVKLDSRDSLRSIEEFSDWILGELKQSPNSVPPSRFEQSTLLVRARSDSGIGPYCLTALPPVSPSSNRTHSISSNRSSLPLYPTQLPLELEDLTSSNFSERLSTHRPITPVPSLSYSQSLTSTTRDTPSPTTSFQLDVVDGSICSTMNRPGDKSIPRQAEHNKSPTQASKDTYMHDTSLPALSSHQNNPRSVFGPPLNRTSTADSDVDPSYKPFRPPPQVPVHSKRSPREVSHIDWDEGNRSRPLMRLKRSIANLRSAKRPHSDLETQQDQDKTPERHPLRIVVSAEYKRSNDKVTHDSERVHKSLRRTSHSNAAPLSTTPFEDPDKVTKADKFSFTAISPSSPIGIGRFGASSPISEATHQLSPTSNANKRTSSVGTEPKQNKFRKLQKWVRGMRSRPSLR